MAVKVFSKVILIAFVAIGHAQNALAFQCSDLFRNQPVGRAEIASELLRLDSLGTGSYVSRWNVRSPEQAGPYAVSGEMMVTSVTNANFHAWLRAVGSRTIGLMVTSLPRYNPGTAGLRLGDTFYTHHQIRTGLEGVKIEEISRRGYTEATFTVSPTEMRAIQEFINDRGASRILAQRDIRGGPRAGEVIRPDFDEQHANLILESCAAASSSFLSPRWLEHYQSPNADILRNLAQRIEFETTAVAKHFIWKNARNPNTLAITLFGHQSTPENFIRENTWGPLRGMPVYGFMPDPISGLTGTIQSERITLEDWVRAQGR